MRKQKNNKSIFVSIASYRDPQILSTIIDCIRQAENPKKIFFGICLQDTKDMFDKLRSLRRKLKLKMKIYHVDWRDSQGACWARYIIQKKLYRQQEFYLQLDSHHRFLEQWDSVLKDIYYKKQKEGIKKPIIGGYCPGYHNNSCDSGAIQISCMDKFTKDGDLVFKPMVINKKISQSTVPARFLSGHFLFCSGLFCKECEYDPNLYFRGEEITLSARAYTHGYSFFHPSTEIIWHYYLRTEENKHWNNHNNSNGFIIAHSTRDKKAKSRVRKLLGSESNDLRFANYGLGNEKTLHDYELYAGLNFKEKLIHSYAYNVRNDSPFAYCMNETEWSNMMVNKLVVVNIDKEVVNSFNSDLQNIILCVENLKGKLLYRIDIEPHQIPALLKDDLVWRGEIGVEDIPAKAIVIPVYKGGRFGNRLSNNRVNHYDVE